MTEKKFCNIGPSNSPLYQNEPNSFEILMIICGAILSIRHSLGNTVVVVVLIVVVMLIDVVMDVVVVIPNANIASLEILRISTRLFQLIDTELNLGRLSTISVTCVPRVFEQCLKYKRN